MAPCFIAGRFFWHGGPPSRGGLDSRRLYRILTVGGLVRATAASTFPFCGPSPPPGRRTARHGGVQTHPHV